MAYGREYKTLDKYLFMFKGKSVPCKKILIKGDPGIGKTTLVKKIAWDWAKEEFTEVSVVFFLHLKSVKPDVAIENAIIEQMPELEGLNVSRSKLESFIEHFCEKCLLILDGLDEHAHGQNKDVLKVIRHQKYLLCNIILTSRPHSTREIEQHFDTIVRVKGFTQNEARKFAHRIIRDAEKVEQVLDFNPAGAKADIVLSECPILLSFMCVLMNDAKGLNLKSSTMPHGEIYMRMIQCLYKKFCFRKKRKFNDRIFFQVLVSLGKLAFETLVSGDPLFERSRVVEEVGEEVFDYGLLIGNEDMINHLIADILITFPHRSIQEFLGAFYFVQILCSKSSVDSLLKQKGAELVLFQNPLFLHFCFWLLSDKCQKEYVAYESRAFETLHHYIFALICGKQLNFRNIAEVYPAIDLHDAVCLEHLGKILELFDDLKFVTLSHDMSVEWTLDRLQGSYNSLKVVVVEDEDLASQNAMLPQLTRCKESDNLLNVVFSIKVHQADLMNKIYDSKIFYKRQPALFYNFTDEASIDLSALLHKDLRKLFINCKKNNTIEILQCDIAMCSLLTDIALVGNVKKIEIKTDVLLALSEAVREGNLSCLRYLCFAKASGLRGNLQCLFSNNTIWSTLTHLCLYDCDLSVDDVLILGTASKRLLPKIVSLILSDDVGSIGPGGQMWFSHQWAKLTSLSLQKLTGDSYFVLQNVFAKGLLDGLVQLRMSLVSKETVFFVNPEQLLEIKYLGLQRCVTSRGNLTELRDLTNQRKLFTLDLSHCPYLAGNLRELMRHNFSSLKTLILSDCGLNSEDLSSLAHDQVEGRLNKLRHLDISNNTHLIEHIFEYSCKWETLRKLNIAHRYCPHSGPGTRSEIPLNGLQRLEPYVERGFLSSMTQLRFSVHELKEKFHLRNKECWRRVTRLEIVPSSSEEDVPLVLGSIADAVEDHIFPSLETICIIYETRLDRVPNLAKEDEKVESEIPEIIQRLMRTGKIVHLIEPHIEELITRIGLD